MASAAQANAIQPRPRRRGARCAPTRVRSAGTTSNSSCGKLAITPWGPGRRAEGSGGAGPGSGVTQALQPPDQQWIRTQSRRRIDERVQHLIVPGCGNAEFRSDRGILRPDPRRPGALEIEHAQRELVESRRSPRERGGMPARGDPRTGRPRHPVAPPATAKTADRRAPRRRRSAAVDREHERGRRGCGQPREALRDGRQRRHRLERDEPGSELGACGAAPRAGRRRQVHERPERDHHRRRTVGCRADQLGQAVERIALDHLWRVGGQAGGCRPQPREPVRPVGRQQRLEPGQIVGSRPARGVRDRPRAARPPRGERWAPHLRRTSRRSAAVHRPRSPGRHRIGRSSGRRPGRAPPTPRARGGRAGRGSGRAPRAAARTGPPRWSGCGARAPPSRRAASSPRASRALRPPGGGGSRRTAPPRTPVTADGARAAARRSGRSRRGRRRCPAPTPPAARTSRELGGGAQVPGSGAVGSHVEWSHGIAL